LNCSRSTEEIGRTAASSLIYVLSAHRPKHRKRKIMFDIALGFLLYYILAAIFSFGLFTVVISFVMNFFTGAGFGQNFKVVWKFIFSILSLGFRKTSV